MPMKDDHLEVARAGEKQQHQHHDKHGEFQQEGVAAQIQAHWEMPPKGTHKAVPST